MLSNTSDFILFLVATGGFLAAVELGFRLGHRRHARSNDDDASHIRALQAALLGLLALLLGFNFAMASSRFDARKALLQEEVDTISRVWLRAQLLPSPQCEEVSQLLKSYISTRIDFIKAGTNETMIEAANAEAWKIEAQIWKLTSAMVANDKGGSQVGLFIQSLNEMVNVKWKRLTMLRNHVPEPVLYLLFVVALGAVGFIGYGNGLTGRRRHVSTAIFAVLIAMVLAIIIDFDSPRRGFIVVAEDSMVTLQASLAQNP